jgi:hypothetical protein
MIFCIMRTRMTVVPWVAKTRRDRTLTQTKATRTQKSMLMRNQTSGVFLIIGLAKSCIQVLSMTVQSPVRRWRMSKARTPERINMLQVAGNGKGEQ